MNKKTGFLEKERRVEPKRDVSTRLKDYKEVYDALTQQDVSDQASRCMDCGIPFCHSGCPLGNLIPDFNDAVFKEDWKEALDILEQTNNFPEFTGRLCPAPCEHACVLGIIKNPVTIEQIEKYIVETGFSNGWIKAQQPEKRTGKTVGIIGSGPAGLAAAQQLNRAGHTVTVYERDDKVGGLLRYGVPDFKLEKDVVDRRVKLLEEEGITFKTKAYIGKNVPVEEVKQNDAIVLCTGATVARPLPIPGADAKGVVSAMHFLKQQNKRVADQEPLDDTNYYSLDYDLDAKGKNVIVIGGGDTGSDCIGTSNRQGAKSVTNFELLNKPPESRSDSTPWPYFALRLYTSTSHEEGVEREWNILTKEFITENGHVTGLKTVEVKWEKDPKSGRMQFTEVPGSEKIWPADLVLVAIGFSGPEQSLMEQLGVKLDQRGTVDAPLTDYQTNVKNIFSAGDCRRGQSLIVWAISEGREAAYNVDKFLMGHSNLPRKGNGGLQS